MGQQGRGVLTPAPSCIWGSAPRCPKLRPFQNCCSPAPAPPSSPAAPAPSCRSPGRGEKTAQRLWISPSSFSQSPLPRNTHPRIITTTTPAFPLLPRPLPELTLVYLSKVPICRPETEPSSKPSRSRCSSHIRTESRASLSPPSREKAAKVRAAQLRKAARYHHFPPSTTHQGGRTCFFLATLIARQEKRCFKYTGVLDAFKG